MAFTSDRYLHQCIPKESPCLGPRVIEKAKLGARLKEFYCIYNTYNSDALLKCHYNQLLKISHTHNNRFSLQNNVLNNTFVHGMVR
jgi:hypothetical protein